jgi:hypothetical protein
MIVVNRNQRRVGKYLAQAELELALLVQLWAIVRR